MGAAFQPGCCCHTNSQGVEKGCCVSQEVLLSKSPANHVPPQLLPHLYQHLASATVTDLRGTGVGSTPSCRAGMYKNRAQHRSAAMGLEWSLVSFPAVQMLWVSQTQPEVTNGDGELRGSGVS